MLMPFMPNTTKPELVSNPEADLAFLDQSIKKPTEEQMVKGIAKHIDKVWQQNQKDNKPIRQEMVNIFRRIRGEYDPTKLAAIRAFKGSEAYVRSGENKARAADSWIKDIYRGDTDLPWILEPTALPELPTNTLEIIEQDCHLYAQQLEQQLIASGAIDNPMTPVDPKQVAKLLQQYYEECVDREKKKLEKDANAKCKRAAQLIRDQNQEGGWAEAFKEFLYYFIRVKAGIIKGPVLTKKKKQVWTPSEIGGYKLETIDTLVNDVYCVSPFNFYPSKGMKKVNDGDIIEIHELSKQSIANLIGVDGYSEIEIRAVLEKHANGELKAKWFTIEDETAVKQVTKDKSTYQSTPVTSNSFDDRSDSIFAQEFYGSVSGRLLVEWGIEGDIDPDVQYQANCWKIGDHVIKAVINPDNLGRKPYHVSSWAKNPEWIWGEGLIEFAKDIEDILNAIVRALQNNIAIASGPLVEIDKDRVDDRSPLYPWRQILSTSMQMKQEGPAVNYYQPQMHTGELINAFQFFSKVMDEMTVPAYAQGASQSGVTAGTATVFTQLLAAASRSIKAVVANIDDDIITPYIQMCYDYNMKFSEDDTIKGEANVVAKGVSGLQAKEQQAQRKVEYLQVVSNPLFAQILGQKNLASILGQIAKSNDIVLPDMEILDGDPTAEALLQQMIQAQAGVMTDNAQGDPNQQNGQMQNGGSATQAQNMNADGSQMGVAYG